MKGKGKIKTFVLKKKKKKPVATLSKRRSSTMLSPMKLEKMATLGAKRIKLKDPSPRAVKNPYIF